MKLWRVCIWRAYKKPIKIFAQYADFHAIKKLISWWEDQFYTLSLFHNIKCTFWQKKTSHFISKTVYRQKPWNALSFPKHFLQILLIQIHTHIELCIYLFFRTVLLRPTKSTTRQSHQIDDRLHKYKNSR